MSYSVKPGDIAGRIGQGLGQGLAEQAPQEMERYRLSQGLRELGQQKDLTPFQQFAGLASTPGTTPQIIQSGGDLLRQQAYLNALKNQYQEQKDTGKPYQPTEQDINIQLEGEIPTLSTPEATAESYKSYIPPTEEQERKDAFKNFEKNPARYNNNFDNALAERKAITTRNNERQQAYQNQEAIAVGKEQIVKNALLAEKEKLGIKNVPPKAYQKFEEKVLNAVLSKKDGGEGLTQEQAIKKYSKELAQANIDYADLGSLSAWSPLDFNRRADALQKNFASRDEQQLMMNQLISDYEISPLFAAHKAYPIEKGKVPTLGKLSIQTGTPGFGVSLPKMNDITYSQLKKEMGNTNSPLSIAYDLQQKGQDPRGWLNYLNNHRDNLEVWQSDQLQKNLNVIDLKDMWLRAWE